MSLTDTRVPNTIERAIFYSVSYLYRRWIKRGRKLFHWLVPRYAVFDHDFTTLIEGKPYVGNLKFGIDYMVFFSQDYEPQNAKILKATAAYLAEHRSAVHFIDIGANVGFTSNLMLRHVDSIHSFEPHPQIFQSLQAKWKAQSSSSWQIHPFGLGVQDSELEYYEPASHNTGTGSFIAGASWNHKTPITLPVRQGDSVLAELNIADVALIKLDVEGYEAFVLQGLTQTLNRDRPVILMETSTILYQLLNQQNLSLQSLLYENAVAVEIRLNTRDREFELNVIDFGEIEFRHQDLLILPGEDVEPLLKQLGAN